MAASVQFRPQKRDLGMVVREVDENLAIFLGMRNAERQANEALRVEHSDKFDNFTGQVAMDDGVLTSNGDQIAAEDEILKLETERSDFEWLLAADTSLLPSVEFGVQDSEATQIDFSNGKGIPLESEHPACGKSSTGSNSSSEPAKPTSVESTSKRPSTSGNRKPVSRSATPTRRSSLPAKPKPSSSSAPSSRTSIPSSKPTAAKSRSSTPAKATSSTFTSRPSVPASSTSKTRSSTPTRKPAAVPSDQPLIVRKTGTSVLKVPLVKSRPSKSLESLSVSHDGTQSLKVLIPKRPVSATRGRPSGPATKNGKPRQKSCSPARVRAPSTAHKSGIMMLSKSRGHGSGADDEVNPVLMGTQMVDRVVNMRKLAPPKQDECLSQDNPKKSSKPSGFGRSLSSRSLDMAVRHMDIRRSMVDGIRSGATGVSSSSSSFGIRSSSAKSGTLVASDSPVASSSDSSEFSSGSSNSRFGDENEMDGSSNMKC